MKVDVRKVQMVGYSTLSISLPKDWVKKIGINPGDLVSIIRLEDGSLKVKPGITGEKETRSHKMVHADTCNEAGMLGRVVIALYLTGADTITIVSNSGLLARQMGEIKAAVERLNGFGIVEQTSKKVMIQSFIDPTRSPVMNLMKRLHTIAGFMIETSYRALREKSLEHVNEVVMAEEEADRIYWLIVRQLLLSSVRPELQQKIGVEIPINVPGHRLVAKLLEKVGDYAEAMALEVKRVMDDGIEIKEKDVEILGKYTSEALSIYTESFMSLASKDTFKANILIESSNMLEDELKKAALNMAYNYLESGGRLSMATALAIKTFVDNLAQIVNLSGTMAELAFNRSVEFSSQACKIEEVNPT